jgi:hypothetical protein
VRVKEREREKEREGGRKKSELIQIKKLTIFY